ncbi:KAP family P-loop domain-containing protein [Parelusimicrobium proximum]|uniref:P-loop NTPase fold protein n=1 Tax=Parelusimicrobium proximum TaxID=3228953 RepID=UPI003D17FB37
MSDNVILPVLQEFISKPQKDMALLINGAWGSGKTFFLRNLSEEDILKKKKVYISLKGIADLKDINREAATQIAFHMKGLKPFAKISGFLKMTDIVSSIGPVDVSNTKDYVFDFLIMGQDFSEYLFIFDDLERLTHKISYAEVLFHIHSLLLENKNSNVIVVADTSKLFSLDNRKEEEESYKQAKDKVISRETCFKQHLKDIYPSYIEYRYSTEPEDVKKFLLEDNAISQLINKTETLNIRQYNSFFDCLVKVFTEIQKIEVKDKTMKADIVMEIVISLRQDFLIDPNKTPQEGKTSTEQAIKDTYERAYEFLEYGVTDPSFEFLRDYNDNGYLNLKLMRKEIRERELYYQEKILLAKESDILRNVEQYTYSDIIEMLQNVELKFSEIYDIKFLVEIYKGLRFLERINLINTDYFQELKTKIFNHITNIILAIKKYHDRDWTWHLHLESGPDDDLIDLMRDIQKEGDVLTTKSREKSFLEKDFSEDLRQYYLCNPKKLLSLLTSKAKDFAKRKDLWEYLDFSSRALHNAPNWREEGTLEIINILIENIIDPNQVEAIRTFALRTYGRYDSKEYAEVFERLKQKSKDLVESYLKNNVLK